MKKLAPICVCFCLLYICGGCGKVYEDPPAEIMSSKVDYTVVGGKIVFQREGVE